MSFPRLATGLLLAVLNATCAAALDAPEVTSPAAGQTIGVSAVTASWTVVRGASGYEVRVLDDAGRTVFTGALAGGAATSAVVSLGNGTYRLLVRGCLAAFSDATCGPFGSVDGVTVALSTPAVAPEVAAPAAGATLTSSTTTLAWSAVAGATSYEVLLRDTTRQRTALRITTLSGATSTVFSLGSGRYELVVRACLSACGPASPAVPFTVSLPTLGTAVPSVTGATASGDQLTLDWTPVDGADLYQVQLVHPTAGPGGGALTVAARQVSTTTATLAAPAGPLSALVTACNGGTCGTPSTPFPVSATLTPQVPSLGTPMAGTVVPGPVVAFSWNRVRVDDATNTTYRLYVADLSRQQPALDVYTTGTAFAAYLAAEGGRYDAQVVANPGCAAAGAGCSAAESAGAASGFNVAGSSAAAPTLAVPAHRGRVSEGNVALGWTPVPGAALYEYYVSGGGRNPAARGVTSGLFAQVPLPASGGQATAYVAIARACPAGTSCAPGSDAGWGPWSDRGGPGVTSFTVAPASSPGTASAFFFQDVAPTGNAVRAGTTGDQRVVQSSGVDVLHWQVLGGQARVYGDPVFSRLANGRWTMTAGTGNNDPRGARTLLYHEADCPQVDAAAVVAIGASTAPACDATGGLAMAKVSRVFEVDGSPYLFSLAGGKVVLVRLGDGVRTAKDLTSVCVRRTRAASLSELGWGEATVVVDSTLAAGLLVSDSAVARRRDGTWVLFVKGIPSGVGCAGGGLCELCARNIYRTTSRDLVTWSALEKVVERASVPEAFTAPDGSVWLYWQSFAETCDAQDLRLAARAPIRGAAEDASGVLGAPVAVVFQGEASQTDTRLHYPTNANPIPLPDAAAEASLLACLRR